MEVVDNITAVSILQNSIKLLRENMLPYCFWLPASFVNLATSSLIIWTIVWSKHLRSKYYIKALHLAVANFFTGSCNLVVANCRVIRGAQFYGEVSTPLRCALDAGVLHFVDLATTGHTLCLAADRVIAIVFPIYYFQLTRPASQWNNAVAWFVSISIPFGIMLLGLNQDPLIVNCQYASTYQVWAEDVAEYLVILLIAATVLCYCIIIVVGAFCRNQQTNRTRHEFAGRLHRKRRKRLTVVSCLVSISFMVTWAVSFVFEVVVGKMPNIDDRRRLMPYSAILPHLSCAVDLLFYCRFDAEFMTAFRKCFACFHRNRKISAAVELISTPAYASQTLRAHS